MGTDVWSYYQLRQKQYSNNKGRLKLIFSIYILLSMSFKPYAKCCHRFTYIQKFKIADAQEIQWVLLSFKMSILSNVIKTNKLTCLFQCKSIIKRLKCVAAPKKTPTICICENKGADQLCSYCTADQHLCFRYTDSTIPLLPKSKISRL